METDAKVRAVPDRPPRRCPSCGSRVAEGAKTCLMCGTSLDEVPVETADEGELDDATSKRRLNWKQIALLVVMAVVILGGSVALGLNLSQNVVPSPTVTPTVTHTPTLTPKPTETLRPTQTPTPRPTPTPVPPEMYTVQSGDTLLSIAADFGLTVQELKAFNNLATDSIVEGETLEIPPPTPTPGPTPTLDPSQPTPTFAPLILHTVRGGETLSEIAELYEISMDDIRMANDMAAGSTEIQANQVLEIPRYTPTPEVTAEAESVQNGPESASAQYTAPTLLYPPDGATFTGPSALVMLQWISAGILEEDEFYRVSVTVPSTDGADTRQNYVKSTAWRVPEDYFPLPEIVDRSFTWSVTVVRQTGTDLDADYTSLSSSGEPREFFWTAVQP